MKSFLKKEIKSEYEEKSISKNTKKSKKTFDMIVKEIIITKEIKIIEITFPKEKLQKFFLLLELTSFSSLSLNDIIKLSLCYFIEL